MNAFNAWLKRVAVLRIRIAMVACDGDKSRAARRLGIDRVTLHRHLVADEKRTLKEAEQAARDAESRARRRAELDDLRARLNLRFRELYFARA